MIELRERPDVTIAGEVLAYELVIGGETVEPEYVSAWASGRQSMHLAIHDPGTWAGFCAHRFADIPPVIQETSTRLRLAELQGTVWIMSNSLPEVGETRKRKFYVRCETGLDLMGWNKVWTPGDFFSELQSQVTGKDAAGMLGMKMPASQGGQLLFELYILDLSVVISQVLSPWLALVGDVLESTERALAARQGAGSLVMRFDFPPQVQGACEQYLTFFAQFLRDLGVEVDTSLRHEGTSALFEVTPQDKNQALEQIARALSLYLQLPDAPGVEMAAFHSTDTQVLQLAAIVQSYSAQLSLGRAALSAAESRLSAQAQEIRSLQREVGFLERESETRLQVISEQRALLQQQARGMENMNVLVESIQSVQQNGEEVDKEEFLDGLVTFGQMEEKGVGINLAKGVRMLRGLLSRGRGDKPPQD